MRGRSTIERPGVFPGVAGPPRRGAAAHPGGAVDVVRRGPPEEGVAPGRGARLVGWGEAMTVGRRALAALAGRGGAGGAPRPSGAPAPPPPPPPPPRGPA